MASRHSGGIPRLLAPACLLAIYLLALAPLQAPNEALAQTPPRDEEIFSLEGPRVKLMLQQASKAEAGRDLGHASELYCEAAFYGSAEAQYRLARIILKDPDRAGGRDKLQMAATLLRNAAGNGHEGAQAMILITGEQNDRLPECLKEAAHALPKWQRLLPLPRLHLKLSYELSLPRKTQAIEASEGC